jgi:hypothetical protein
MARSGAAGLGSPVLVAGLFLAPINFAYNGAMSEDIPKIRWFRWSLRTFLLAVAILCVWLGWNVNLVHQRNELRHDIRRNGGYIILDSHVLGPLDADDNEVTGNLVFDVTGPEYELSLVRRLLGDERVAGIMLGRQSDVSEARRLFPEIEVFPILPEHLRLD